MNFWSALSSSGAASKTFQPVCCRRSSATRARVVLPTPCSPTSRIERGGSPHSARSTASASATSAACCTIAGPASASWWPEPPERLKEDLVDELSSRRPQLVAQRQRHLAQFFRVLRGD